MPGTRFTLEVRPQIPPQLERLNELANDLYYSWDRNTRSLFLRMDPELWERCGHNPKVFLRQVSQEVLQTACEDRIFIEDYERVLSAYDNYIDEQPKAELDNYFNRATDKVAYFCAEFGFHESFPIYSGGLGILAGDHCKAASDIGLPFVAVGLLYRQGYFSQTIDADGNQIAHYRPHDFHDLPIQPVMDSDGNELHITLGMPHRSVELKVWRAQAGHIQLYLLDSDLPANSDQDRAMTYQLYGGDVHTRIQQEIILGIGGVRALRALGIQPTVWHINEGHAAFQIIERIREYTEQGLDFATALEIVAGATVFTTHTPVPAGHDIFDGALMREYFHYFANELHVPLEILLELGHSPVNSGSFNQTALGMRGSRFHNGVSRIHCRVASEMENYLWPQTAPEENPITYVTNGVHVPSFLAREWVNQLDMHFSGSWRNEMLNTAFWERIEEIPDHSFWSLRQSLKSNLFKDVRKRAVIQHRRNGFSESQLHKLTHNLDPRETDILTIGFARRFATYKRATVLFSDPERLARLLNDPQHPVIFLFAGKAHPKDQPGQELIRQIHHYSHLPQFEGKIVLIENFDLALARKMVTGVDVWLNNPQFPLEASGTSGQKAGINGVMNLSITDGWWGEGYNGENGWAITPHGPKFDPNFSNREEASELLDLLEHKVIPLYYARNGHGFSEQWVKRSKSSMKSLIPHFNAQRMVMDYVRRLYGPAQQHYDRLCADNMAGARELATWKKHVAELWPMVSAHRTDEPKRDIPAGQSLPITVAVDLHGLRPQDVIVECLVETEEETGESHLKETHQLTYQGENDNGQTLYGIQLRTGLSGLQYYKLRLYPYHPLLAHRFENGLMLWL